MGAAAVGMHTQPGGARVGTELAVGDERGEVAQRQAGTCTRFERGPGVNPVVKGQALPGDFLGAFVAFAGNQQQVAVVHALHRAGNRGRPIRLQLPVAGCGQRGNHLRQDVLRVFAAGVVAGEDDMAGRLCRNRAHQGAFAGIAVTAATDHAPQFSAARARHGA